MRAHRDSSVCSFARWSERVCRSVAKKTLEYDALSFINDACQTMVDVMMVMKKKRTNDGPTVLLRVRWTGGRLMV